MKKIALVILSVLVGFSAIAKNHKAKKKQPATTDCGITSVLMMHTGCFGHCPTYSVEINKNGIVTYSAIQFNTDSGNFQKNIGVAEAVAILCDLAKDKVDTCLDMYENRVPDLPNVNYEIVYKNKTKKIYSAKYGPDFLKDMTKTIDDIGKKKEGDTGWKRAPEAKK